MSKPKTFLLDGYSERFRPSIAMDKQIKVIELTPITLLLGEAAQQLRRQRETGTDWPSQRPDPTCMALAEKIEKTLAAIEAA